MIGMVFEHIDYRIIYMNGKHPDDILDYPEWEGNSVGHWEGDTLVVDTIGMREESWLDSVGLQHSAKMHMVERYTKTSPDTLHFEGHGRRSRVFHETVYLCELTLSGMINRIIPERCADTPLDEKYTLTHGQGRPHHRILLQRSRREWHGHILAPIRMRSRAQAGRGRPRRW